MSTHRLKIRTAWLDRVRAGEKRAEVRRHDRDYQVGDHLEFVEVKEETGAFGYIGQAAYGVERVALRATVTHVLPGHMVDGLADDYCVLSIEVAS